MRKLLVLIAATALLAGACGSDDDDADTAQTAKEKTGKAAKKVGGPQDLTVKLEPKTDDFNVEWTTFFPNKLQAHPGDKIEFTLEDGSGAPHTVTMGKLIDEALAKSARFTPQTPIADTEKVLNDLKIPDVFPHGPSQGPPSLNQSAAQPCFLAAGTPPFSSPGGAPACPKVEQPEFDGTAALYNSGILTNSGDSFDVRLAKTVKPGTYSMMCLIHRQGMSGQITVVPENQKIPSAEEVSAAGTRQRDELLTKLRPVFDKGKQATPDKAAAGTGDPAAPAIIAEFLPKEVSIPVGGTVTWSVFGFHTVAFNASDADAVILAKGADGTWALTPKAGAPAGFDTPPEAGQFPPGPKPIVVDGRSWDGSGFRNTGVLGSLPPQFVTVKQTFSKAGTYTVNCLLHPDMKGQVKVV